MSPARLLWRGLFLLLAGVLLVAGILLARSASWRADVLADLDFGAEVVKTDGSDIQYIVRGSGPPLLVLHGAPGGYDQALALAEACGIFSATIIAPSRPGYLGTPLGSRLLPAQQARVMVALLDALGIQQTAVLAFSSSAPVGLAMALNFPERLSALAIISGVGTRLPHRGDDEPAPLPRAISDGLTGDVGAALAAWTLENHPDRFLDAALPLIIQVNDFERNEMKQAILADPEKLESIRQIAASVWPLSVRETGTRNDLFQLQGLEKMAVENIEVPVLVVHGTADPFVPVEMARALAASIPGADFLPVEKSGHLVWLGSDGPRAMAALWEFFDLQSAEEAAPESVPGESPGREETIDESP